MSESGATERGPEPTGAPPAQPGGTTEPDVLLDIPQVTVDQIRLAVDELDADVSLRVRLANLLQLDAGVRVHLEGVELDVTGVSAEALLKVRLEKLVEILDRALTTIDRNPQVIEALARTVSTGVEDVSRSVHELTRAGLPVVERTGQQVGTLGAVADRTLRDRVAEPVPPAAPPPTEAQPPEPPTGPARPVEPVRPAQPATSRPAEPATSRPAEPVTGPARPEVETGAAAAAEQERGEASTAVPGAVSTGGGPSGGGRSGGRSPGASGAAQMAGQAGETLRQAGRSVWEAIQGGMGQNRQQRPKR
jgi:hypothetical protein